MAFESVHEMHDNFLPLDFHFHTEFPTASHLEEANNWMAFFVLTLDENENKAIETRIVDWRGGWEMLWNNGWRKYWALRKLCHSTSASAQPPAEGRILFVSTLWYNAFFAWKSLLFEVFALEWVVLSLTNHTTSHSPLEWEASVLRLLALTCWRTEINVKQSCQCCNMQIPCDRQAWWLHATRAWLNCRSIGNFLSNL